MKTLVTGATGLLGSALTRQLVATAADVRILRRPTSRLDLVGAEAAAAVEHAVGDLADVASLRAAMEGVATVYHVAAAVDLRADPDVLYAVNVEGTAHVVNAALAAGVQRLVHTSSVAALGLPAHPADRIDEDTPWQDAPPRSAYARSKRAAELEVYRGLAEGLDAVIVNPALVFGVGRPGANTRRLVDAVRAGWARVVPPGGTGVVDAEDAAAALRRAMAAGAPGQRYVLCAENLSWRRLAATLALALDAPPPLVTLPPRLVHAAAALSEAWAFVTRTPPWLARPRAATLVARRRYDAARARDALGCSFRPFTATARRLADALR